MAQRPGVPENYDNATASAVGMDLIAVQQVTLTEATQVASAEMQMDGPEA